MSLIFTYGVQEDAQALCDMFIEYQRELDGFGMDYTLLEEGLLSSIQGKIRSRMTLCAVAKDDDKLIGFLFCSVSRLSGYTYEGSPLFGYISDTYVVKDYRGRGVAKELCQMALNWLAENDVGYVELKVLENNKNGHTFWQKQGFSPATRVYGKRITKTEE